MVHRLFAARDGRMAGACRAGGGVTAMALKTVQLSLPATTADLAKLELGTVVYLNGRLFTAREGVYHYAVEEGHALPAGPDEIGRANFHCSPAASIAADRSEERRVGKECRSRWSRDHEKKEESNECVAAIVS